MAPEMVTELKALLGLVRQRWIGREALVQRLEELERTALRTDACQFDKAIAWGGQRE